MEFLAGLMEESTKESTLMIKKKEMVSFTGLMVENTKVNGAMESNME